MNLDRLKKLLSGNPKGVKIEPDRINQTDGSYIIRYVLDGTLHRTDGPAKEYYNELPSD